MGDRSEYGSAARAADARQLPLRPAAILFDLLFAWDGGWRLEGIAVQTQPSPR